MNKKMLIAIVATIAIVVVGTFGFTFAKELIIKSDPVNYLLYSTVQNKYEAVDASLSGKVTIDENLLSDSLNYFTADSEAMSKFVASLFNEVQISGNMKWKLDFDNKEMTLLENIDINYSDKPLISMRASTNKDFLLIGSDTLLDKPLMLSKLELFELINEQSGMDLNQINFDKYIEILDMEKDPLFLTFSKDYKGYETIVRKALASLKKGEKTIVTLSNGKTIDCDVLELSLTTDDLTRVMIDLLSEVKRDDALKALVKGKLIEALNLLLSSEDYKVLKIEASDIIKTLADVESNFDEVWATSIEEMLYSYQDAQYELSKSIAQSPIYDIKFAIDSKYNIRQMNYSTSVMGVGIEQTIIYNAFNDDVIIDIEFPSDVVSLKQIIKDQDYAAKVGKDVVEQALTNVINSDALTMIMTDMKDNSDVLGDDEQKIILNAVDYFNENRGTLKDVILDLMGMSN